MTTGIHQPTFTGLRKPTIRMASQLWRLGCASAAVDVAMPVHFWRRGRPGELLYRLAQGR